MVHYIFEGEGGDTGQYLLRKIPVQEKALKNIMQKNCALQKNSFMTCSLKRILVQIGWHEATTCKTPLRCDASKSVIINNFIKVSSKIAV